MKVCVIGSGSTGNMTYVETKEGKFLIDAGISLNDAILRTDDIDFSSIDGIFVTHSHWDHINYLDTVAKKTNAIVYLSHECFDDLKPKIRKGLINHPLSFIEGESIYHIKDIDLYTLNLSHDTKTTFGFIIDDGSKRFGYFTDTGIFPTRYKSLLSSINFLMIEANHNISMLQNSGRPYFLIQRILSSKGHMSNQACFEVLSEVLSDKNEYVILSHISKDCNSTEMIEEEITSRLNTSAKILLAKRDEALPMIVL